MAKVLKAKNEQVDCLATTTILDRPADSKDGARQAVVNKQVPSAHPRRALRGDTAARQRAKENMEPSRSGRAKQTVNYQQQSDSDHDPIESASSSDSEPDNSSDFMDVDDSDQKQRKQQRQNRVQAERRQPMRAAAVAAQAAAAAESGDSDDAVDLIDDSGASEVESDSPEAQLGKKGRKQQQQRNRTAVISSEDGDDAGDSKEGTPGVLLQSDSDFETAAPRQQPEIRKPRRKAAAAPSSPDEQQQTPSELEDLDMADEQQPQPQPAAKKSGATVAAANTSTRRLTRVKQQQPAEAEPSRRRTRGAAAAAAAEAAFAPEAPARPRRAAAAAATAATAAALRSEAQPLRFRSRTPSSDDFVAADDSDSDLEPAASGEGEDEEMLDAVDTDVDGSGDADDEIEDNSDDADDSALKTKQAAASKRSAAVKQLRRRGSNSSPELGQAESDVDDEGSANADKALDLSAFAYNGKSAPAPAAGKRGKAAKSNSNSPAAAEHDAAAGQAKGRGGRGSRAASPDTIEGMTAALDAEEAEAADVADASEFEPQVLRKLPKGDDVDKILAVRYESDGTMEALVKLVGKSYRAAVWVPSKNVEAKGKGQLLRNFVARQAAGEGAEGSGIDPTCYQVDRILEGWAGRKGNPDEYLVKWCGLEYSEATWETQPEVMRDGKGRAALMRFNRWTAIPQTPPHVARRPAKSLLDQKLLPSFRNGRALRDYQETSLHWMISNYYGVKDSKGWQPRNCILGDEMGLGKTAQSIAVMAWLKQYGRVRGPFMVVAPLTTLGHWQREIQTWTAMNVVMYTGSAHDRQVIRETEFYYPLDRSHSKKLGVRFDVLLVSYETVLKDKSELRRVAYEALILDEAHRLKSRTSATRAALLELPVHWWLLLSGTPVQNNMRELQGLMSVVDEEQYGDLDEFLGKFGDTAPTVEQIKALQAALAPVLLRRMKEDVEDLPEKEEVVIWVELTQEQKRYYKALYAQQIGSLLQGVAKNNLPGMRNLAMELRKMCCHPFLCNGLEQDMLARWAAAKAAGSDGTAEGVNSEVDAITRASGKMLLLHKLLPKLRSEGRQVLIFSQFKIMLDVLEDYLTACQYPCERIDGDTNHKDRQAAIDRFMAGKDKRGASSSRGTTPAPGDADGVGVQEGPGRSRSATPTPCGAGDDHEAPFVFLLSTKAGGQGITLTSADTVIIYDSDWNPQNDLQAMARCHRIGQDRDVTVYRLVSKNTYEEQLFRTASRKYGLDEAILGFSGAGDNPENDAARIMKLLKDGAHAFAGEADAAAAGDAAGGEEKGMAQEDIDQILAGRSEKRQLGSRKGNTFSIAHFAAAGGAEAEAEAEDDAVDAKTFWAELLPEAAAAHAAALEEAKQPELLGRRRRTVVDYREKNMSRKIGSDSDSDFDGDEGPGNKRRRKGDGADPDTSMAEGGDNEGEGARKKSKKAAAPAAPTTVDDPELGRTISIWKAAHVEVVEKQLLMFGPDRAELVLRKSGLIDRQPDEITQLGAAIMTLLEQIDKYQPPAQSGTAAAAAAAGQAGGDAAAADHDTSKGRHRPEAIRELHQKLIDAGVQDLLPSATRKALLGHDVLRRVMRNTEALLQHLHDHQKVHQKMMAAAAAEGGTPRKSDGSSSPPAAAGTPLQSPGKQSRRFVVPKVPLTKGLPAWWSRHDDDSLVRGSYQLGYPVRRTEGIIEEALKAPSLGFHIKVALDPVEAFRAVHIPPTPTPPPPPAAAPDGSTVAPAAPASSAPAPPVLSQQQLALLTNAQLEKKRLAAAAAAAGRVEGMQFMGLREWKKFVGACVMRLKKVRQCMLDPNYVSAPTPAKPEPVVLNLSRPSTVPTVAAAPGTSAQQPAAQQRLNFGTDALGNPTYKGKPVVGGLPSSVANGKPASTAALLASQQAAVRAAAAAAAGKPAGSRPLAAVHVAASRPLAAAASSQPAAASAGAAHQPAAAAASQGPKRSADAAFGAAGAKALILDSDSDGEFQEVGKSGRGQQSGAGTTAAFKKLKAAAVPDSEDVIDLIDNSPKPDSITPGSAAAGGPSAAAGGRIAAVKPVPASKPPPSTGLVVRKIPADTPLSQGQSMDVDEPSQSGAAAAIASRIAAGDDAYSKQQMQQILGSAQRTTSAEGSAGALKQPQQQQHVEGHPVYGTPAGAAAGDVSQKRVSSGAASKAAKDDKKQRKLESFFAVQKK